jgi:predicted DCC family thiol-disulfide oxidoreductase YuxK
VLVTKNRHWVKSQAVLNIAEELGMPIPLVASLMQLFAAPIRDVLYDWISRNRYDLFGEAPQCRMMQPEWRDRFLD